MAKSGFNAERLRTLMSAYWLRPETALWRSLDLEAMKGFSFSSPSLDLGGGDGVFSFIRAGGTFDFSFDVFQSVGHIDKFFENVDVYDHWNGKLSSDILRQPDYKIDVIADHKANLLRKAEMLGLYGKTVLADANTRLPFGDEEFRTVFSNMVYWLNEPEGAIREIARVLRKGGRGCLLLPDRQLLKASFYQELVVKSKRPEFKFLEWIDRGRMADNVKHCRTGKEWEKCITSAGLKIVDHRRQISLLTGRIWDIGLRPMFPVLQKMFAKLSADDRMEIKKEFVELFMRFALPLAERDAASPEKEKIFHCIIFEKAV